MSSIIWSFSHIWHQLGPSHSLRFCHILIYGLFAAASLFRLTCWFHIHLLLFISKIQSKIVDSISIVYCLSKTSVAHMSRIIWSFPIYAITLGTVFVFSIVLHATCTGAGPNTRQTMVDQCPRTKGQYGWRSVTYGAGNNGLASGDPILALTQHAPTSSSKAAAACCDT